ncbi:GrpB family protein [Paenibacillus aestuarii]|uniref:GrpB family protein n=1 Tax=Paenibacillus aestuarii TaxID=516965 RepID=A0ABW0K8A3_9BACL
MHHLYVCTMENSNYMLHILFRDYYLRNHPEDTKQYGVT